MYLVIVVMGLVEWNDPHHHVSTIDYIYGIHLNRAVIDTAVIWFQILVACLLSMYPFFRISMTLWIATCSADEQ